MMKIPRPTLRISVIAFAICQIYSSNVWAAKAEAERIAELEKKLEKSLQQIEKLSNRLAELEKTAKPANTLPAPSTTATAATGVPAANAESDAKIMAAQSQRIEALEQSVAQISESASKTPTNQGVPLHGFADVGYANSSKNVSDKRKRGFVLGNADFYLTPDFGDRVKALVELNFEYGEAGNLATDLERLQLGYTFSDSLTLWAGRFHTPYGIWNTAFHHGAQIQPSIDRPKLIAFEDQGGILPAHTVGLWATGGWSLGEGKLEYDAYLGNGDRILDGTLDFNAVRDDNNNLLIGGNLRYRFGGDLDGLTLGAHGFTKHVSAYTAGVLKNTTKINVLGGYIAYETDGWENIAEYYHFNDNDLVGRGNKTNSWAGFVQIGRTFWGNVSPYVRAEKASLNQNDNYFASQESGRSYTRQVLGVKYDLNAKSALKIEVNHTNESKDGGEKYNEAKVQLSTRF